MLYKSFFDHMIEFYYCLVSVFLYHLHALRHFVRFVHYDVDTAEQAFALALHFLIVLCSTGDGRHDHAEQTLYLRMDVGCLAIRLPHDRLGRDILPAQVFRRTIGHVPR